VYFTFVCAIAATPTACGLFNINGLSTKIQTCEFSCACCRVLHYLPQIVLIKNQAFGSKIEFLNIARNFNFWRKFQFLLKIEIPGKFISSTIQIEIPVKNRTFGKK